MIKTQTQGGYLIYVPELFNNYKVIKELGYGSSCVVTLVEDQTTHEKYSAKIISKENAIQLNILKDIYKEIEILKKLDHPNIIKIYDSLEIQNDISKQLIILILEYCENGTLLDYVLNTKTKVQKTLKRIINQLPQMIKYLHDKGIAHGDIKGDNILLDSNFNPKLADFGYCHTKIIQDDDQSKKSTIYYAAPELFTYGKFNTLKADIYAFGILLYTIEQKEFPFNESPFQQNEWQYIIYQKMKGKLNIGKRTSEKLKKLVMKCTEFDPMKRPTIDEIINDEYFVENNETNEKQNCMNIEKTKSSNVIEESFVFEQNLRSVEKTINNEKIYDSMIDKYETQIYANIMKNKSKKRKRTKKYKKTDRSKQSKNKYRIEEKYHEKEIVDA